MEKRAILFVWQVFVLSYFLGTCKAKAAKCQDGLHIEPISMSEVNASQNSMVNSSIGHGPSEVFLKRAGWCFDYEKLLSVPYVQLTFPQLYAVYNITIAGANGSQGYVTKLQIETDIKGNEDFQLIRNPTSNLSHIFNTGLTSTTNQNTVILSDSDIGVGSRQLRIRPYSWTEKPCMRLEIYGCLADPGPSSTNCTDPSSTDCTLIVLRTVLPIVAITLVVTAIAIISVTVCHFLQRRSKRKKVVGKKKIALMDDDRTIKHVKNELYQSTERGFLEESSASSTQLVSRPQPYEQATPKYQSNLVTDTGYEYSQVDLTGSSSMSSAGYTKVKKRRKVKAYKTVTLESLKTTTSQSTDVEYSVAQNPRSETAGSDLGYSVVKIPEVEVELAQSVDEGYIVVPSPKENDDSYLSVSAPNKEIELGITESYGPEHFEV